jgi:GH24 family phage-related lysozyme (muramidase)
MNVSRDGIALIKEFEGFPFGGRPYQDSVGVWTIGYGHTEGVGPHSRRISERDAAKLLEHDLDATYARAVAALPMAGDLNQHQFDALVCFVYNVGTGAIGPDTGIGRALRAQDWSRAADELLRWDKAGGRALAGLTRRRHAERELFLRPVHVNPLAALTPAERWWCKEYDSLLALKRAGRDTPQLQQRRRMLRKAMVQQRKLIWRAAEAVAGGWDQLNRRARYRALRARTT